MLLRYNVSNFKSIGHSVEFSMLPPQDNTDERFLRTIKTKAGDWKVLCRAGLFGPNASGKSAFIKSLSFARDFIVEGQKTGASIGIDQFRGEFKDIGQVSSFQFMFYLNGDVYEYGFAVDRRQVHEEWLMLLTEKDFVPLFTRVTGSDGKTKIDIESKFARKNSKDRNLAETLKESIQEKQKNQLFLCKLYENGNKKAEQIVDWFYSLQVIFPESEFEAFPVKVSYDNNFREFISKNLKNLDTGVSDISIISEDVDFHELSDKLNFPQKLIEHIEQAKNGFAKLNNTYIIFWDSGEKISISQIKFEHKLNDRITKLNFDDESDGTKRLFNLLPILFEVEQEGSWIYFVDEIDRSLHTRLSWYLLNEFIEKCESTSNQIIFTTHDVNLLNLEDFRQDEIWFVEKNNLGESELRSLSDFDVKEGQNTLKAYLNGRFGAVPVIRGDR